MAAPDLLIYFENPVGYILEHPAGYAVVQYKPGERRFDEFRAFLTHVGELLRRRGWHRLLGDQRHMARFTPDESAWVQQHWLSPHSGRPEGLLTAILLPRDAFASLAVSQALMEAKVSVLTYRFFDEDETPAAEAWLRQVA